MLDRQTPGRAGNRGKKPLPPSVLFAKFPPDDADLPAGPPAPAGGGYADDGNFKRGRFSPIAILVALLLVAGAVAAIFLGARAEHDKMTVEEISKEKKNIFVLPQKEQIPRWRKWAADSSEPMLQQEALIQLAWAEDAEGPPLAAKAMAQPDHRVRGVCAQVLAYYGSPRADAGKGPLLEALKTADDSDRPQIVWALVALREPAVFKEAMDAYRVGFLSKVERLGGGSAFDADLLSGLVTLDELAKLADDKSPSVRQLVATVLSRNAESKWTPVLV
ncbi:MAG: HEAT repeat domain-containing protein, partial [Minicystis sp.]